MKKVASVRVHVTFEHPSIVNVDVGSPPLRLVRSLRVSICVIDFDSIRDVFIGLLETIVPSWGVNFFPSLFLLSDTEEGILYKDKPHQYQCNVGEYYTLLTK